MKQPLRAMTPDELVQAIVARDCPKNGVVLVDLSGYGVRGAHAPYVHAVTFDCQSGDPAGHYVLLHISTADRSQQ